MITVARGGADYNKYFPPNTFINAADFRSASELGRYLKRLVEHPGEYFDILRHKMMYRYKTSLVVTGFCSSSFTWPKGIFIFVCFPTTF